MESSIQSVIKESHRTNQKETTINNSKIKTMQAENTDGSIFPDHSDQQLMAQRRVKHQRAKEESLFDLP